jgi:hypothetical protein
MREEEAVSMNQPASHDSKVPARPSAPKHAIDTPEGGPSAPEEQPNPGDPGPPVLRPDEPDEEDE